MGDSVRQPLFQHEFFETAADRHAQDPAVDDHGAITTYGALEEQANRLANVLRDEGCGPNRRVCVFTGKTAQMYAGILGTLKASGCWVPLNTAFPDERLRHLLTMLDPVAVVVDDTTVAPAVRALEQAALACPLVLPALSAPAGSSRVLDRDVVSRSSSARPACRDLTGEDLAYVIFTSGSTGTPKGVMVRHRNTAHFLSLCRTFFDIERGSRFAHFSDLTFDPSIFDLFHCWDTGGVVVPANRRSYRIDPGRFLIEQQIEVLFAVPTTLAGVRDSGWLRHPALDRLRHILLTGEPVPAPLVCDWYAAHGDATLYNMYGTTETAIVSHWCRLPRELRREDPVPLGQPLPGMRVRLLDGDRLVDRGEPGESVVSGSQVSPGYWASPFLTQRSYGPDPLDPAVPTTVYRTGDLLREGPDGAHYFVGRIDSQVKVRGHRVELGEVENTLLASESVREAAVVLVERSGPGSCLVAFVKTDGSFSDEHLREYLRLRLPHYMIPTLILPIAGDMPRGATGKLDRTSLKVRAAGALAPETGYAG